MQILSVLIQHPKMSLDRGFSYLYDGPYEVKPGCRVLVEFHNQRVMGYVERVDHSEASKEELSRINGFELSFIASLIDKEPLLNDELYHLVDEVSAYYLAPKISVLQAMLPASLKPAISSLRGPKIAYETWVEVIDPDEEGLTDKQKEAMRLILANGQILKKEVGSDSVVKTLLKHNKIRLLKRRRNVSSFPNTKRKRSPVNSLSPKRSGG